MFRRNLVCFGNELKQDHDLAKVGIEGSSPFARSKIFNGNGLALRALAGLWPS
jgi:hypothetical protein